MPIAGYNVRINVKKSYGNFYFFQSYEEKKNQLMITDGEDKSFENTFEISVAKTLALLESKFELLETKIEESKQPEK